MLLRVGIVSMLLAVVIAVAVAVGVTTYGGNGEPDPPVAVAEPRATETPPEKEEPDTGGKDRTVGEVRQEPRGEVGQEPRASEVPTKPEERNDELRSSRDEPSHRNEALPVSTEDWTRPSREEIGAANGPRYYPPLRDAVMTLTMDDIGIYDAPVLNSTSARALSRGVVHVPETPMPWNERRQKNVYLAGHRVGTPGTGSRTIFYNLDKLSVGDSVVLKDRDGNAYNYRVSEVFVVEPDAGWVLDTVRNRDMVTLQTCTYPTFENRLIVRADRV